MFDAQTTALLLALLDEVCHDVSRCATGAKVHVASKNLEAATKGETTADGLKLVGRTALSSVPTMWRT